MACSIPHSDDEIQVLVQKQIDEDMVHQKAILDLALQFDNACTTQEDLRKAYEKCNHIPQESHALIDTFLKEALRETLEEQTMDEKALEEKIRQKQADDDEYFMEFRMDSNFTNENDPWEYSHDIDDSDLHLTHVLRLSSSAHVEPSPYTPNPVTIIPGPAGVVQLSNIICVEPSSLTSNPKVVEDVGEDVDFNSGVWVSATNYVNASGGTVTGCLRDIDNFLKKEKLEQVVAIVKSCSLNALGDLNVTLKDISGTVPGSP
nr:hypothetical protein [Tanacetum cinerariifolium]GEZ89704.1 hypothetical protein [Tanacetum cinerariifolium]